MIFFKRFNSSNISSRKELNPPPVWGTLTGAGAGAGAGAEIDDGALGGLAGTPVAGAAGGVGLLANDGVWTTPLFGACGGPVPATGGNLGAGGKLVRLGGPPVEGAFGGTPLAGLFGGPTVGEEGGASIAGEALAIAGAAPGVPLNKLNNVLAAAVFAWPVEADTTFLEDVLTVFSDGSTETSFKSFSALFNDFIKSLIPLTVSSKSSERDSNPFFIKFTTLSNFFWSFETNLPSIPLAFLIFYGIIYSYSSNCIILIYIFIFIFL